MSGIDAHHHLWNYDPQKYSWISEEMSNIRRDFSPKDIKPHLDTHSFEGAVAVQAVQSEQETQFLLAYAQEYPWIVGVVGWLDLCDEALPQRLAYYSQNPKLKGIRHVVQAEPDDYFMLKEDFVRGIAQLHNFGLTYDILIFPKQLPAAIELVGKFPNQPFVLDHIAKPFIKDQVMGSWDTHIRELAQHPHVFCKLSGMVTEAKWDNWTYEEFLPYLEVIFEAFGVERLMVGSDWPVCEVAGGYDSTLEIVKRFIAPLPEKEQQAIWGGNARRFYHL
ncbi:MAG: amidohydrolase family protein [Bacteroidota bacterium]